jgi:hypothetical protein
MKYIENTRASRGDFRPLNAYRKPSPKQTPGWAFLLGIAFLIAIIYFSNP